ncbi:MAG: hypothetical protein WCA12_08340 [Burkholderiales bacterium]
MKPNYPRGSPALKPPQQYVTTAALAIGRLDPKSDALFVGRGDSCLQVLNK